MQHAVVAVERRLLDHHDGVGAVGQRGAGRDFRARAAKRWPCAASGPCKMRSTIRSRAGESADGAGGVRRDDARTRPSPSARTAARRASRRRRRPRHVPRPCRGRLARCARSGTTASRSRCRASSNEMVDVVKGTHGRHRDRPRRRGAQLGNQTVSPAPAGRPLRIPAARRRRVRR